MNEIKKINYIQKIHLPKIWIGFIIAGLCLTVNFIELYFISKNPEYPTTIFNTPPLTLSLWFCGLGYWLFCVYKIHKSLEFFFTSSTQHIKYPISPHTAVINHFIPFFNIYWFFEWPIKLSKFVNNQGRINMVSGELLGFFLFISLFLHKAVGLLCIFFIGNYITNKLKKHINLYISSPLIAISDSYEDYTYFVKLIFACSVWFIFYWLFNIVFSESSITDFYFFICKEYKFSVYAQEFIMILINLLLLVITYAITIYYLPKNE